jgi:hypothetical protein
MVRMMLPKILPPTYRGTAVRYLYYLSSTLHWSPAVVENGNGHHSASVSGLEPVVSLFFSQLLQLAVGNKAIDSTVQFFFTFFFSFISFHDPLF